MNKYLSIIIVFGILILLVIFIPNKDSNYVKSGKLFINEVVAKNDNIILDKYQKYSDYIEIYNGYNYKINLEGYHLSDDVFESSKWTFPDISIDAKSYILVFASGNDNCSDLECHTNFKLSSLGESVVLTDRDNNIISRIKYKNLNSNISYGYYNDKYIYMKNPSPLKDNISDEIKISNKKYDLVINEYMNHNKNVLYNSLGYYNDWVEIYNNSSKDVNVLGLCLSDDINNLCKYILPDYKIDKYGYLIIYLSSIDKFVNNEIHSNFKIGDNDYIIISNGKDIFDKIKTIKLYDNVSYGLVDSEWYYFTSPTPGYENKTAAFKDLEGVYDGGS